MAPWGLVVRMNAESRGQRIVMKDERGKMGCSKDY
jgi:hypothetical protein